MTSGMEDELVKVRQWSMQARPTKFARTTCMNFIFGDGQNAIPAGPFTIETTIGFNGRLTLARIKPDVSGTAAFTLGTCDFPAYPTFVDFTQGNAPALATALSADLVITAWKRYVRVQDEMLCTLVSTDGTLKQVTLSLTFRLIDAGKTTLT